MADAPPDITAPIDPPVTFFRRKGNRSNHRKRPPTPPPKPSSDSDSDYSSTDETGAKLPTKRRKTKHVVSSSSSAAKPIEDTVTSLNGPTYAADRSATISKSDDATKRSNWHNENEEEYLIRKSKPQSEEGTEEPTADGVYRGSSAYKSFIKKNPDSIQNKGKMGPVKAPTNVRQVVTVDFAPDVCKDYKQTGFCGFGDTCKFLHAREDYKQGWQLDRDWEVSSKKKQGGKDTSKDDEDDDDKELANIPFKCVICKGDYKVPIVTKCGHYFCEKCALQRYRKTPSCAICGAGTNGIFNTAKNLQKKLDKKREREEAKKEEEGEEGEKAGASGITIEE